mmetsp:Transcript_3651/g.8089  ORF Transcript_3651/g.8089 Transcript_3651/m.8089 type:complete len:585 (+) Transcript_3651:53-1807(+)
MPTNSMLNNAISYKSTMLSRQLSKAAVVGPGRRHTTSVLSVIVGHHHINYQSSTNDNIMVRQHKTPIRRWLMLLAVIATTTIRHADCFTQNNNIFLSIGSYFSTRCRRPSSSLSPLFSSSAAHKEEDLHFDLNHCYGRFRKFRTAPYHAPQIRKILLVSDLHMDYPANQEWLYNLCTSDDAGDTAIESQTLILIAGDVSHDLEILRWTFQTLKMKFGEVAFTPGNHELWIDKERKLKVATQLDADDDSARTSRCRPSGRGDGCTTSIEKLEKVLQLCLDEDVRIGPVKVGSDIVNEASSRSGQPVWLIPLLSWHHFSFDTEPSIECWGGIPSARKVVADYRRTVWPSPLSSLDDSVSQFIDGLNDIILDLGDIKIEDTPMLTFSHFLPRIELLPEKRYLSLPTLHSCIGSTFLETRLRRLGNCMDKNGNTDHLHAFGHSHLAWDAVIDGVRYVHVPLAYPREWEQRRRSLEIGSMNGEESENRLPVCIWDNSLGEKNSKADSEYTSTGFPSQWLGGWWSKYYAVMPRQPHRNTELAPWAAKRFRQLPGGQIESFDHVKVELQYQLQCPSSWTAGTGKWYDQHAK